MSFKLGRFFYLAISFAIGSLFLIFGTLSIALPWFSFLQTMTAHLIFEHTLILFIFGLGFTLIGFSIFVYAFLKTRRHYVQIRIGKFSISLDENVVHQYLENYWKEHFPEAHVPFDLSFNKHSLQIVADLPTLPLREQKAFLERIKQDFSDLFGRVLGYPYDVHFIASFQSDKVPAERTE
jgi:hypothetical protein